MAEPSDDIFAVEPSGYIGSTACRKGLNLLPGRYVQPRWREQPSVVGSYGPDTGWHLSECCPAADVAALDVLAYGQRIRLMLNGVSERCIGMATAGDIVAFHGVAVRLALRLPPRGDGSDALAENKRIIGEVVRRLSAVEALPVLIFGHTPPEVWLFWMLDGPDSIEGDPARYRAYNALAYRFAEAVGGVADTDAALTDVPMPGICGSREGAVNTVLGSLPGHPVPTYGARFEDLEAVLDRIKALPPVKSAA